jgi:hypothetical protein
MVKIFIIERNRFCSVVRSFAPKKQLFIPAAPVHHKANEVGLHQATLTLANSKSSRRDSIRIGKVSPFLSDK